MRLVGGHLDTETKVTPGSVCVAGEGGGGKEGKGEHTVLTLRPKSNQGMRVWWGKGGSKEGKGETHFLDTETKVTPGEKGGGGKGHWGQ